MAENGCGSFALEAVTLICRAMARLEVGEMGVVSYGGSNSMTPLHPLEKPFTDADGAGIMAQMKFAQVYFASESASKLTLECGHRSQNDGKSVTLILFVCCLSMQQCCG